MGNSVNDPSDLEGRTRRQVERVQNFDQSSDREALVAWANKLLTGDYAVSTVGNYLCAVRLTSERADKPLVDFESSEEIIDLLESIQSGSHPDVKSEGLNVRPYKVALRVFFGDHLEREWYDDIEVGQPDVTPITEDDVFSSDETDALLEAARHPRDMALVAFMLVTGQRSTAVLSVRVGDVSLDDQSGKVHLNDEATGMKGASGPRPLLWARPYIVNWLENHPRRDDPDAPLFCCLKGGSRPKEDGTSSWERGDVLSKDQLDNRLNSLAEDAGIDPDRVSPHTSRHSAITRMRNQGINDDRIRFMIGVAEDSDILERYDQATDEKMMNRLREDHGMDTGEDEVGRPTIENCPQCRQTLRESTRYCPSCGTAMTMEAAERVETTRETVQDELVTIEDSEKRQFARDTLSEIESDAEFVDAVADEVMARLD